MPTLTLDDNTVYAYEDSGPLSDGTYTTVFMVHGFTFHSAIFQRILPLAAKSNLRFVTINRRDYPGTSPSTPEQIKLIQEGNDGKVKYMQDRGREIVEFMDKFIQRNKIPKPNADKKEGGVVVFGWSLGNLTWLALFSALSSYPKELTDRLESHLKLFIFCDCNLDYPIPPEGYVPLYDNSLTADEQIMKFGLWITSYYKHPNLAARNISGLEGKMPPHGRKFTAFTPEEMGMLMQPPTPALADHYFRQNGDTYAALIDEVFFPKEPIWKGVGVVALWFDETAWAIPYGLWKLEDSLKAKHAANPQRWMRSWENVSYPGGNHFVPWDDPQNFTNAISRFATRGS